MIGSHCPEQIRALQGENIDIRGFVTEEELIAAYQQARISIVPLRYGAGVKGKVIESMQYGVPVLTTAIGKLLSDDSLCLKKIEASDKILAGAFSKQSARDAVKSILGN